MVEEERFGQGLRDVAIVGDELAEEAADQARQRGAVVGVAGRQTEGEQFAAIIDDQMQLEAVESADRGLAAARIDPKDAVLVDAGGMADDERGRVHETDSGAFSKLGVQIDRERHEHARQQRDDAGVAHQVRELAAQVHLHMLGVEGFEGAIARLLEEDEDRHELAG